MNKKLTTALTLLCLLCFGMMAQALAQTQAPGVKGGDYFVFSINSQWSSSNSSLTVPPYLLEVNTTDYYRVMISDVQSPNVTATNVWHFQNGTDINSLAILDLNTGELVYYIPGVPAFQGFSYANISVNEPLYPLIEGSPTMNQTITRDYGSGQRETNVITLTYNVTDITNSTLGTETASLYFDKLTGVLVERSVYTEFPDQNGSEIWTLTETNLWTVPIAQVELPLPLPVIIAIVAVIVVAIVAVLFLKNRKKSKKRSKP